MLQHIARLLTSASYGLDQRRKYGGSFGIDYARMALEFARETRLSYHRRQLP